MQTTQLAIAEGVPLAPLEFKLEYELHSRVVVGARCKGHCGTLASFQQLRPWVDILEVIRQVNGALPEIHSAHGFHGGITAQQIVASFDGGAPTLLKWWQAKKIVQHIGAYALFKGSFKYLKEYDYLDLLWVLADCIALKSNLDPPSVKFARLLADDDQAAI